ncbi:MAG: GNAT family N-acetyltransferase [Isosphaeraceae bacterium]
MIRFRPFLNGDPPALVNLWNRALPDFGVVRPLNVHEFDPLVIGKLGFERAGLIVAERAGQVVGWVHAGFGPAEPKGPSHQLDVRMGAVVMLVTEPDANDPDLEQGLLLAAERYLRGRGAQVIYAGGQSPLNPFYWGLYGGSEFAGILGTHASFLRAAERAGYEPVAATVLLEADLSRPEVRDPRAPLNRRQFRLDVTEDVLPNGWWDALAIGLFRPTLFQLFDKQQPRAVPHEPIGARATTWDIAAGLAANDGRARTGLIELDVSSSRRRQGAGRYLVAEILRHARTQFVDVVAVQTSATNTPALTLYHALGFEQVDTATLYRLPAALLGRSSG